MAGMVPKYTEQLVLLTTEEDGDLVAALEKLMKAGGDAVSRADVLRQALAPGLKKLAGKQDPAALNAAIEEARSDRLRRAEKRAERKLAGAAQG